jgi:hypothetical protein
MPARELVREQYGPVGARGQVTAVKDGPFTQRVVRDDAGRIVSLEGRSRVDDVSDRVEGLEESAEELSERLRALEAEPTAEVVRDCRDAIARAEARIAERLGSVGGSIDASVERCESSAVAVEASVAALADRARELHEAAWRLDGWVTGGGLRFHPGRIAEAGKRLGVTWRIRVRFMTEDEIAEHPDWNGFRRASTTAVHELVLRPGRDAASTARTLRHEIGHTSQIERLGGPKFSEIYRTPEGEAALESEADVLAAEIADLDLVREVTVSGV